MGRATWFDADGRKRGEWTEEEDQKLKAYIDDYGIGDWRFLPDKAGLRRCGKSCRLRWLNYLRPGIKKGKFTPEEEQTIIYFHSVLGNRWAAMAQQMPSRSDNDIKNHWNSCLKKRLERNGIDPMTHKPIIKVPSFNRESGSSASSSTASPSSSSPSSSARLLNKLASGFSSRINNVDRIKNILSSDPTINNVQEEQVEELMMKDHGKNIASDDFVMRDEGEMRRFMEQIGAIEFETTSYDGLYNYSLEFSSPLYGSYDKTHGLFDDHLF